MFPQKYNIVADRGRNLALNANEYYLGEKKAEAFSKGMALTEVKKVGCMSTSLSPTAGA